MLTDRFFELVTERLFYGSLPDFQKIPLVNLYEEAVIRGLSKQQLSYLFATTYWETDRYKAKEEYSKGAGRPYGQPTLMITGEYKKYYGRGFVQTTWLRNYGIMTAAASARFGREIDLVNNPELIYTDDDVNAFVAFEGMIRGLFTGRKLGDYINDSKCDYVNARRVVNGTDKAENIADIAREFEYALLDVEMNGANDGPKEEKPFRFRR